MSLPTVEKVLRRLPQGTKIAVESTGSWYLCPGSWRASDFYLRIGLSDASVESGSILDESKRPQAAFLRECLKNLSKGNANNS